MTKKKHVIIMTYASIGSNSIEEEAVSKCFPLTAGFKIKSKIQEYIEYFEDYNLSLSKRSVDPAHRGRRDWAKWDVLKLARRYIEHCSIIVK